MNSASHKLATSADLGPGFIRIPAAAEYLGISVSGLRKLVNRRLIRVYRPTSRLILFRKADIDEAMERFGSGGVKK